MWEKFQLKYTDDIFSPIRLAKKRNLIIHCVGAVQYYKVYMLNKPIYWICYNITVYNFEPQESVLAISKN